MQFVKYLASLLICITSSNTLAFSIVNHYCGNVLFLTKIHDANNYMERQYNLYYLYKGEHILVYTTQEGIGFYISCLKNSEGHPLIVFQESCGGNACSEEVYSIFDPDTKKMLVHGTDFYKSNIKEAEVILGYQPPYLIEDDSLAFCCSVEQK